MSDEQGRARRMQVLLRLRELEQQGAALTLQQAQGEEQRARQQFDRQRQRYEATYQAVLPRLSPELHGWRLAAIDQLRTGAQAAGQQWQACARAAGEARQALARRRLDVRVAERARDAAERALAQDHERRQRDECLDLQLFARREEP